MKTHTLAGTHIHSQTHEHMQTRTQKRIHMQTHIYTQTCIHMQPYTLADTHTHADTHIHSEIHVCHWAEGNAARHSASVPSCSELPDPPLFTHSCTPSSLQAIFTTYPLGAWLRPWSDTSYVPWASPTWGSCSPRAAYKHSWEEGCRRAGEAAISQPAGCRRQAAAEAPLGRQPVGTLG